MRKGMAVCLLFAGLCGVTKHRRPAARCSVCQRHREGTGRRNHGSSRHDIGEDAGVPRGVDSVRRFRTRRSPNVKCREENRFRLGVLATVAVGLAQGAFQAPSRDGGMAADDGPPEVVTLDTSKDERAGWQWCCGARAPELVRPHGQTCRRRLAFTRIAFSGTTPADFRLASVRMPAFGLSAASGS